MKYAWQIGSFIEKEGYIDMFGEQKLKKQDCECKIQPCKQDQKKYCINGDSKRALHIWRFR